MTAGEFRVRRATLEDIAQLTALWNTMRFSPEELARRITEFQVAEDAQGTIAGALGIQLGQKQGFIHSEGFSDYGLSDRLRPLFWNRLQALANNHGLLRFWTRESAPFWMQIGLAKPDEEALAKLPAAWQDGPGDLLTIKLREDVDELLSADKEFALFQESERERSERVQHQAKALKLFATLIAIVLFVLVLAAAFFIFRHYPALTSAPR